MWLIHEGDGDNDNEKCDFCFPGVTPSTNVGTVL
jgi:hypothetical protein